MHSSRLNFPLRSIVLEWCEQKKKEKNYVSSEALECTDRLILCQRESNQNVDEGPRLPLTHNSQRIQGGHQPMLKVGEQEMKLVVRAIQSGNNYNYKLRVQASLCVKTHHVLQ